MFLINQKDKRVSLKLKEDIMKELKIITFKYIFIKLKFMYFSSKCYISIKNFYKLVRFFL